VRHQQRDLFPDLRGPQFDPQLPVLLLHRGNPFVRFLDRGPRPPRRRRFQAQERPLHHLVAQLVKLRRADPQFLAGLGNLLLPQDRFQHHLQPAACLIRSLRFVYQPWSQWMPSPHGGSLRFMAGAALRFVPDSAAGRSPAFPLFIFHFQDTTLSSSCSVTPGSRSTAAIFSARTAGRRRRLPFAFGAGAWIPAVRCETRNSACLRAHSRSSSTTCFLSSDTSFSGARLRLPLRGSHACTNPAIARDSTA
jgi:hypothetical protein